jgi:hypothetical protein
LPSNIPSRVTVLLAVSYDGYFLPPLIVFKAKPGGKVEKEFENDNFNYPNDCFFVVQENAWCDQRVMDFWIEKVYNPFVLSMDVLIIDKMDSKYDHSLLIMDNFSVHCTLETAKKLSDSGSRLMLLPANTTSKTLVIKI